MGAVCLVAVVWADGGRQGESEWVALVQVVGAKGSGIVRAWG